MKRLLILKMIVVLFTVSCSNFRPFIELETDLFKMSIDRHGLLRGFMDKKTGTNYLEENTAAPLLSIRINQEIMIPASADFDKGNQIVLLSFQEDIRAKIKVESKETHFTFELVDISDSDDIELIVWGPYPTTINKVIGETVGVVRGEEYAIGIQALNIKTLGGYPWNENDHLPQIDIFDSEKNYDMATGRRGVLYSVEAAKPTEFGSTLQAYCRNRFRDRIIKNWEHEKFMAPALEDGGIIGSKIALFGCPVDRTLDTIGAIEIAEDLPHPQIDGQWGKKAPLASAAYMILNFSEGDIDRALDITRKAGLRYVYHSDPFETWGHFKLKEQYFPKGIPSLKRCVEKAKAVGIDVGIHTLSNFITTNDPYVTPVPDDRLAIIGSSSLTQDVDSKQKDITIEAPDFFNQFKRNFLKTVVIGHELIQYSGVSEQAPWTLLDCQRGAFGTTASTHTKGDKISKLADHGYKVFLTNAELSITVAKNIADLFNKTGLRQISFDGLEGNHSTGLGNYGEVLFTKTWYDSLDEDIKRHYIADASRSGHYFWHIFTRMNWGEPWYAGFRESQTEYRLRNQAYFQRNFMPGMLGWFKMTSETSLEDIEWMLARSAAFDAGYAFYSDYKSIEGNGFSEEILGLLGQWERARISGAFNQEQKRRMEDINNEFHLTPFNEKEWKLFQVYSYKFKHGNEEKKAGEPLSSTFAFENPADEQPMHFILSAADRRIQDIRLEVDNSKFVELNITLQPGQALKYTGGDRAVIYSKTWQRQKEIEIDADTLTLSRGSHSLSFNCKFPEKKDSDVKLELRFLGRPEAVRVN